MSYSYNELQLLIQNPKYLRLLKGWLEGKANTDSFISNQYTEEKLLRRIAACIAYDIRRIEKLDEVLSA